MRSESSIRTGANRAALIEGLFRYILKCLSLFIVLQLSFTVVNSSIKKRFPNILCTACLSAL